MIQNHSLGDIYTCCAEYKEWICIGPERCKHRTYIRENIELSAISEDETVKNTEQYLPSVRMLALMTLLRGLVLRTAKVMRVATSFI